VTESSCQAVKDDGQPCHAPRLRDGEFCFWHSPEHAEEAAEAQRLGGLRRRREKAVSGAYDFDGLADVGQVQRLLEIAASDTLSLENSVARSRTLAYLAQVALKALEVGELAERIDALERLVAPRLEKAEKRR
jgi:hypothetical protein